MNPFQENAPDLPLLNLPQASLRLRREGEAGVWKVYDPLRRKVVALTPEEWVRQHFVAWLLSPAMGYPRGLMANEVSLRLNDTARRCDTVLFSRRGLQPLMIIEYKAPHILLTQKVFEQIRRYTSVLLAPYLAVSNGLTHYCLHIDYAQKTASFLPRFPLYADLEGRLG